MEAAAGARGIGRNNDPAAAAAATVRDPLVTVRDRLFHTLFYRLTLTYARTCPRPARRVLETLMLLKAVLCFLALIYVHMAFSRRPVRCLQSVQDSWPRDGVVRVEIIRGAPEDYSLGHSYEKERILQARNGQQHDTSELFLFFSAFTGPGIMEDFFGEMSTHDEESETTVDELSDWTTENSTTSVVHDLKASEGFLPDNPNYTAGEESPTLETPLENATMIVLDHEEKETDPVAPQESIDEIDDEEDAALVAREKTHRSIFAPPEEEYLVEYSLEYGFLRLSPATRQKLNISVELVVLDPDRDECFGDSLSKFILEGFLGYDDVLMSSIKSLAENEDNKGYLRNVVTGAHYHFVSRWASSWSYVVAGVVMMLFTISISMLLRYSQNQIFVFIVELLQMLELNTVVSFPAAPLLTVILALVGIEAIMSEFFEDTATAFYIILIVWIADQYDSVCCHTNITKRHWLKFFYLYHFSFYAYHYRFSGQYSGLALVTMWLFTQHSMFYFFHHYELPVILQQAQIQDILMRNQADGGPPPAFRITATTSAQALAAAAEANNNNDEIDNNVERRTIIRGFNVDGIRFRFGILVRNVTTPQWLRRVRVSPAPPQPPRPSSTEAAPISPSSTSDAERQITPLEATQGGGSPPEQGEAESPPVEGATTATGGEAVVTESSNGSVQCDGGSTEDAAADSSELLREELLQPPDSLRAMQSELDQLSRDLRASSRREEGSQSYS